MRANIVESLVGFIVLVTAGAFLNLAYKTTDLGDNKNTYKVIAKFDRIDGINLGGDVRISGVKIGKVSDIKLDPKSFRAELQLEIKEDYKLPVDSSAEILGGMLLGDKYIAIVPGNDDDILKENSLMEYTQSSISFEAMISKFLFSSAEKSAQEAPKNETK